MLQFTEGNLLEADAEALVNTVNTVGVMGKGIALMFKDRFRENTRAYEDACKAGKVRIGHMYVTPTNELTGPKWIINFPTKKHWRQPSRVEWIEAGLDDLVRTVHERDIRSVAVPPLGCGNGGLEWSVVRPLIERAAAQIPDVKVIAYEPTQKYQNVAKRTGVEKLTIPRALISESVRRYWMLGIECTILEIQKLAWFLERAIERQQLDDVLHLSFDANRYGPYSHSLIKLLDDLDGSYLRSDKRVGDCTPQDTIAFDDSKADRVATFLRSSEAKPYLSVLQETDQLIDGFQSPLGLELLATADWLVRREHCSLEVLALREGLRHWPAGSEAAKRKLRLFNDRLLGLAVERLRSVTP